MEVSRKETAVDPNLVSSSGKGFTTRSASVLAEFVTRLLKLEQSGSRKLALRLSGHLAVVAGEAVRWLAGRLACQVARCLTDSLLALLACRLAVWLAIYCHFCIACPIEFEIFILYCFSPENQDSGPGNQDSWWS